MTDRPLVSIVIPVYNGGAWLAEAIDSALAQTWLNLEVLVVDDGSTDDGWTRSVAESYGDQIRFFSKTNGGVGSALNLGVAEMRGQFFSWLSHDDRYLPGKVERQVKALLAQPAPAIAFGDARAIDASGRFLGELDLTSNLRSADHPIWWILEQRMSGCTLMVPRECFALCGGFDEALPTTQDCDLWYRMAQRFPFLPTPGYFVESRVHDAQGSRVDSHLTEAAALWRRMIEETLNGVAPVMAPSRLGFLQRCLALGATTVYPGLAEEIEALISTCRQGERVTIAVEAEDVDLAEIRAALGAVGLDQLDFVFVDRPPRAVPGRADDYRQWRREGVLLTLSPIADLNQLARHVLAATKGSMLVFYNSSTHKALKSQIAAVEAGAASVLVSAPGAASLFEGLGGAVVRPAALAEALSFTRRTDVAGLTQALAMADPGDWREVGL